MSRSASKNKESSRTSARRKHDHVDIVLNRDVAFHSKTTGFEDVDFVHNALPEIDFRDIDPSIIFLNKNIKAPLMVSCMTGGFARGASINRLLASVCEEVGIPMGVGSQRIMLDNPKRDKSFSVVREMAPSIPVLANIGATEVARLQKDEYRIEDFYRLVDVIDADAFAIHCNPLQELLQPEGNTNFSGVLDGIALLVEKLSCPIIIKEVGAGISKDVARRVLAVGVTYIDIAGAGGTSWSGIEMYRRRGGDSSHAFWDWGIPTRESLEAVAAMRSEYPALRIIASGGIYDGFTAAKAIALGSDIVGAARVFLETGIRGGKRSLKKQFLRWIEDFKSVMFLTGARSVADLQRVQMKKNKITNMKIIE
jgi:isopentenyl-diphosphate Delta-isomerase